MPSCILSSKAGKFVNNSKWVGLQFGYMLDDTSYLGRKGCVCLKSKRVLTIRPYPALKFHVTGKL